MRYRHPTASARLSNVHVLYPHKPMHRALLRKRMNALLLWQLLIALIALLAGLRLLTEWLWQFLSATAPGLWQLLAWVSGARWLSARLKPRWPRFSACLEARFSTARFTGLPLTLMALLASFLVFLGVKLVQALFSGNQLTLLDQHINAALGFARNPYFLDLFGAVTWLADKNIAPVIVLATIILLWACKHARYIPGFVLAALGSQIMTWAAKFAIDRPRPEFITFATATTPSFPSAHATGAIAVYGFIAYALARDLKNGRLRFEIAFWGAAFIMLIALSRLLLNVHYPSDVAAGLLVGGFWLLAGAMLTEYLREYNAQQK